MSAKPAGESGAFDHLASTVQATLRRFDLLGQNEEPVVVALSGGKDSILLCLVLRELGITIAPVTIDMGYESGWAERIRKLVAPVGLDPRVVDVRAERPDAAAGAISLRLTVLDRISQTSLKQGLTPCTHCYSVKAVALERIARELGSRTVAFGHHMTDSQASLVKEALLHLDRAHHEKYDRARFESLAEELYAETRSEKGGPVLDGIEELVARGRVDTDEPPRQPLTGGGSMIEIVRPLALVGESEVEAVVTEQRIETMGSGCGHGATLSTQTPREIVHWRVLRGLPATADARLRSAVLGGLTDRGERTIHARARRHELLGEAYKPIEAGLDKL